MPVAAGTPELPAHGRVTIIGAGIAGCSVAYHLSELGWSDVVVIDQGPLFETGGSTSHAPGLVFVANFSQAMTRFAHYTTELYDRLRLNGARVWNGVGGLEVAWTPQRLVDLKRKVSAGRAWGVETHLLGADEARARLPLLSERIHGAMYTPADGVAEPHAAAAAMAALAAARGVRFFGSTRVTGIDVAGGRVRAVRTERGSIGTEIVVCAAGIWGPLVGRMAGVALPLLPLRHQFAVTEPLAALAGEQSRVRFPILRHQDRAMYFRQEREGFVIGSYDHEPLVVEPEDILSHEEAPVMPSMAEWSESAFRNAMVAAGELLPALRGAALDRKVNGMFVFTPDGMPVLGESPQVRGFWAAEAVWITHAGGVGRAVAEWIAEGQPSIDLWPCDVSRFQPHQLTPAYVRERGAQQYREVYDIIHPLQQMRTPRRLRLLPYHERLKALGAHFVESAGWERPQWYAANRVLLGGSTGHGLRRHGWSARYWSPIIGAEHRAVRERVGLFDLTPFTKLEVSGACATALLQKLCANQVDRPVGSIVYTAMLTPSGGIKCDLTVTRLAEDRYMVVTGGATSEHDRAWIERHVPRDGSVRVEDGSGRRCCIGLWGPLARELLRRLTEEDLSDGGFPYLTARPLSLAEVPALAARISYVGELGWELYAPIEFGRRLWDLLWHAGEDLGVVAAGLGAFDSMRLEKGYRLWGADIHTEYNPYEAGLGFAVKLRKGDFIGRDALRRSRSAGITRRLRCLTLDDASVALLGSEPVLTGGEVTGYVTSADYGYSVGRSIAYGYLPAESAELGARVQVESFGELHAATVTGEPLWDPAGERMRA